MINLESQLEGFEKLLKLMHKYKVKETSIDYVHIIIDRFEAAEPTPKQLLEQHTLPSTEDLKAKSRAHVEEVEAWLNKADPDVR